MSNTNPARGMRDFLPDAVRKREYVIGIIKEVYEKYGFEPLETPTIENLSTLTNKYGEEGDQLMFKILKRGEKLKQELENADNLTENDLSDLALRYDLTVPLARVVANYKNDLPKFFKRYQIQPVWRADRPARGRYREFYQCDVDAIGSKSMLVEAELISAVCEILKRFGFEDFEVHINHRLILDGIMELSYVDKDKRSIVLGIIDKLDKIGVDGVKKELSNYKIEENSINAIIYNMKNEDVYISAGQTYQYSSDRFTYNNERLNFTYHSFYKYLNNESEGYINGNKGVDELKNILSLIAGNNLSNEILYEPSLARGLSYYTGAIFEIVLTKGDFSGSIGGGGRYDGLIGMFGKEEIPAVGFSLGLERILLIMEERGMFPDDLTTNSADVLVTLWNEETVGESLKLANELRQNGLRVTVYPEADKLGKQFKYADQIGVEYVCVLGENELAENKVRLKNLKTGEQEDLAREEIAEKIKL